MYTITITCPTYSDYLALFYYIEYVQSILLVSSKGMVVTLEFIKPLDISGNNIP